MSSKDFVDALARGSNLDAEDAFKSAVGQKVQDTLENKKKRTCKRICEQSHTRTRR